MRPIDADAMEKQAYDDAHYYAELEDWEFDVVTHYLDKAPTIDAVPVVRCRDCKHWNKDALACDTLPWVDSSEHVNWYENDFCSYGERKDGDG